MDFQLQRIAANIAIRCNDCNFFLCMSYGINGLSIYL